MFARRARMNRRGVGGSGGGAPFSPDSIVGLVYWGETQFTADVTVNTTPDPDQVSAWLDHHTTANDLVQATPANQPEWEGLTGWEATHPSMEFRIANSNYLHNNDALGALIAGDDIPFTIVTAIQKVANGASDTYIFAWGHSTNATPFTALRLNSTGVLNFFTRDDASASSTLSTGTTLDTDPHIISLVRPAAGAITVRLDGVDISPATPLTAQGVASIDRFAVACLLRSTAALFAAIRLGGLLVYTGALGTPDLVQLETYLQARWGTPALP